MHEMHDRIVLNKLRFETEEPSNVVQTHLVQRVVSVVLLCLFSNEAERFKHFINVETRTKQGAIKDFSKEI